MYDSTVLMNIWKFFGLRVYVYSTR